MRLTRKARERRLAIARDVQEQIRGGAYRFRAHYGYIKPEWGDNAWLCTLEGDLQEHVEEVAKKCDVCLLGGALLSKARLFNHAPIPKDSAEIYVEFSGQNVRRLLRDTFSNRTMTLMEAAFESYHSFDYGRFLRHPLTQYTRRIPFLCRTAEQHEAAIFGQEAAKAYALGPHDAEARVWAVMNNLLINDGEFIQTQEPNLAGFPYPVLHKAEAEAQPCN